MRRYLDYAIFWDILFCIIISTVIYIKRSAISNCIQLPTNDSINALGISLITVSATLIGFMLTIVTVIITFKKGFEKKNKRTLKTEDQNIVPNETIFEKTISKETKFYDSDIHKKVVNVFINATYEIGLVLFVLLLFQFCTCNLSLFWLGILSFDFLILVSLAVIRSLYIFKLFLNVHI